MLSFVKQIHNCLYKRHKKVYYFISYLYKFRSCLFLPPYLESICPILNNYAIQKNGRVAFIQIGSNNGISNDPLHELIVKEHWSGILVEPIPYLFNELIKNYEGNEARLKFINAAVGLHSGTVPIYTIDESYISNLPRWCFQLASFNKDVIYSHVKFEPRLADAIITKNVLVVTFNELAAQLNKKNLDLLHIDTEGYDYEILKSIDWTNYKPEIIIFEHKHLNLSDFKYAIRMFKKLNYFICVTDYDVICIKDNCKSVIRGIKVMPFYYKTKIR